MRSTQLRLEDYDSDKVANRYLEHYDPILAPWVSQPIALLELGIHTGGSLRLWRDYFPLGTIVGVDIKLREELRPADRIHMFEGSQADPRFLSRVANEMAPAGFDIVIDDASHIAESTSIAFWHLFDNHLKPGGLYVIEDWGTGYWDDWPDGHGLDLETYRPSAFARGASWLKTIAGFSRKKPLPCHSYGMVGFVKQLVDEQGAHDVTRRRWTGTPTRRSRVQSTLITPSIVFIRKWP